MKLVENEHSAEESTLAPGAETAVRDEFVKIKVYSLFFSAYVGVTIFLASHSMIVGIGAAVAMYTVCYSVLFVGEQIVMAIREKK